MYGDAIVDDGQNEAEPSATAGRSQQRRWIGLFLLAIVLLLPAGVFYAASGVPRWVPGAERLNNWLVTLPVGPGGG